MTATGFDSEAAAADPLLIALPVQLAEVSDGVVIKRGVSTLKIEGSGAGPAVRTLLDRANKPGTRADLLDAFDPEDHAAIEQLIDRLIARRILTGAGDPSADRREDHASDEERDSEPFYWNFGTTQAAVVARLDAARITVLGVNAVSRSLVAALLAGPASQVDVVDYQLLRSGSFFNDAGIAASKWPDGLPAPMPYQEWSDGLAEDDRPFIIATSDFGVSPALRHWNQYCVSNKFSYFPVVLHDLIGQIGPLVIPGETPCYECARARQNSHMADPVAARAPEARAFEEQHLAGFHPALAEVTGDIAAMELLKFHAGIPLWRVGSLIEVNLMAPSIAVRKVLKVPRCTVCSPTQSRSTATLDTRVYNLTYDQR